MDARGGHEPGAGGMPRRCWAALGSCLPKGSQQCSLFRSTGSAVTQGTGRKGEGRLGRGTFWVRDRSCLLKGTARPSPNLAQEPAGLSYLAVSVAHSRGSAPCSWNHGCSSPVVLNLQEKSTNCPLQPWAPAPSSTRCLLPWDSPVAVAEAIPHLR